MLEGQQDESQSIVHHRCQIVNYIFKFVNAGIMIQIGCQGQH